MKKEYSLVHIGRDTFIMLNAKDKLLNNMCNSTIFENKEDATLNTNVFAYFDLKVHIIADKLDRRTKRFKHYANNYGYFSASLLPELKKRVESKAYTRKFTQKQLKE